MFIEPTYFYEIKNNAQSEIIFAPRGGGKTAQRKILHQFCQKRMPHQKKILSVLYTDFTNILEKVKNDTAKIEIKHHHEEIIRNTVNSLYELLSRRKTLKKLNEVFDSFAMLYFRWLITHYFGSNFDKYISLLEDEKIVLSYKNKNDQEIEINPSERISSSNENHLNNKIRSTKKQHLENLFMYIRKLDIDAIYILIDGVDETPITADISLKNAINAVNIIGYPLKPRHPDFNSFPGSAWECSLEALPPVARGRAWERVSLTVAP